MKTRIGLVVVVLMLIGTGAAFAQEGMRTTGEWPGLLSPSW